MLFLIKESPNYHIHFTGWKYIVPSRSYWILKSWKIGISIIKSGQLCHNYLTTFIRAYFRYSWKWINNFSITAIENVYYHQRTNVQTTEQKKYFWHSFVLSFVFLSFVLFFLGNVKNISIFFVLLFSTMQSDM